MHIPNTSILENPEVELPAKLLYFYLCFVKDYQKADLFCISVSTISEELGFSAPRIYRARKILCAMGVLEHSPIHCIKTGKKIKDQYELL